METTTPLFVGTANRVSAFDRTTGRVIWRTKLSGSFIKFGSDFVSLEYDGTALYATAYGDLYCLDPATGQVRWTADLGAGSGGAVAFASASSSARAAAETRRRSDES